MPVMQAWGPHYPCGYNPSTGKRRWKGPRGSVVSQSSWTSVLRDREKPPSWQWLLASPYTCIHLHAQNTQKKRIPCRRRLARDDECTSRGNGVKSYLKSINRWKGKKSITLKTPSLGHSIQYYSEQESREPPMGFSPWDSVLWPVFSQSTWRMWVLMSPPFLYCLLVNTCDS